MPSWADPHSRRVLAAVTVLTLVRPLSLLWLAVITAALLVFYADRSALLRLVRARVILAAVPVLVLTAGSTLVWVVFRDALMQQDVTTFADFSPYQALITSVGKLDDEFRQMIGTFSWLSIPAPAWAYTAFPVALGAVAAVALPAAGRQHSSCIFGLAALVVVLPVAMELSSYRASAFAWQGRYTLPLAVGIPLLMGLRPNRGRDPAGRTGIVTAVIVVVASIHVASFAGPLIEFLRGIDALWTGSPDGWNPRVPGCPGPRVHRPRRGRAWAARRLAATPGSPPRTPVGLVVGNGENERPDRFAQAASTPTM